MIPIGLFLLNPIRPDNPKLTPKNELRAWDIVGFLIFYFLEYEMQCRLGLSKEYRESQKCKFDHLTLVQIKINENSNKI